MWPNLTYGMHLAVNLVPPVLAPLLLTILAYDIRGTSLLEFVSLLIF